MYEANLSGLIDALNEAKENDFGHDGPVNGYLLEHVLQPMFRGNMPDPDSLCFDAFDIPDILEAADYLEEEEALWRRSMSVAENLHRLPSRISGGFC